MSDLTPHDAPPPVLDEGGLLGLDPEAAAARVADLPMSTRFRLRSQITPLQRAALDRWGFLVFSQVLTPAEVARMQEEILAVQARLVADGTTAVFGVPVWVGEDPEGKPFLQRTGFFSVQSAWAKELVHDGRFEAVRQLIGDDARIGDQEKDGLVLNRYLNTPGSLRPALGWHTDAMRDLFYNFAVPGPMLNVGLHLDRVRPEDGGLRILPGTHRDGFWKMAFRKPYFVAHRPDSAEVAVETWPGDLTVHDGRAWHRVEVSPKQGWASLRTSMYLPYVRDAYQPKDERSKPMWYLRVATWVMNAKKALRRRA
jgi:hypothetical protein